MFTQFQLLVFKSTYFLEFKRAYGHIMSDSMLIIKLLRLLSKHRLLNINNALCLLCVKMLSRHNFRRTIACVLFSVFMLPAWRPYGAKLRLLFNCVNILSFFQFNSCVIGYILIVEWLVILAVEVISALFFVFFGLFCHVIFTIKWWCFIHKFWFVGSRGHFRGQLSQTVTYWHLMAVLGRLRVLGLDLQWLWIQLYAHILLVWLVCRYRVLCFFENIIFGQLFTSSIGIGIGIGAGLLCIECYFWYGLIISSLSIISFPSGRYLFWLDFGHSGRRLSGTASRIITSISVGVGIGISWMLIRKGIWKRLFTLTARSFRSYRVLLGLNEESPLLRNTSSPLHSSLWANDRCKRIIEISCYFNRPIADRGLILLLRMMRRLASVLPRVSLFTHFTALML